jgi:16S rRNA (adenine1518-N6/adenine1519-N6)-dimethyltransferase
LVYLKVRTTPLLELDDYKFFRKTIKSAFSQRRKTLKNCLINSGFNKEKISQALLELGLDENIRGEKLSITQLGEISKLLK